MSLTFHLIEVREPLLHNIFVINTILHFLHEKTLGKNKKEKEIEADFVKLMKHRQKGGVKTETGSRLRTT